MYAIRSYYACLCEYTSHGHCGLVSPEGVVQNDPTLALLARTARNNFV